MSTPFLGEIKICSFNFAPKGWAFCNGQLLAINQNQALFAILGTTYGGNGVQTFALPNLQGRVPLHMGGGISQGKSGGEQNVTLSVSQLPAHTHVPTGLSNSASQAAPRNNLWAQSSSKPFSNTAVSTAMNPAAVTSTGGSQSHNNMPPYLVVNFVIALTGIFPSRN
jgi:microcystin-dependent protein